MPDQQLDERFDALREAGQRFAPPVAPDVLRRRGHLRRVRRQVGTAVATGGLAVAAITAGASLMGDDLVDREVAPPAATVPATPAPSVDVAPSPSPSPTDPAPTAEPTTGPTTQPTGEATTAPTQDAAAPGDYDVPASGEDFGYVTGVELVDGTTYLLFDRATLLTGEEGRAAREAAGLPTEEGVDSLSVYVENENPRIRRVPLAEDVQVVGDAALGGVPAERRPVDLQVLVDHVTSGGEPLLVEMTYDANREVSSVREFFMP